MITANEARIGNYFGYGVHQVEITGISTKEVPNSVVRRDHFFVKWLGHHCHCVYSAELEPIPLSLEWLLNAGFELNDNGQPQIDTHEGYALSISAGDNPYKYTAWHVIKADHKYFMFSRCEFVHQVQNLFFSIMGHELVCVNDYKSGS